MNSNLFLPAAMIVSALLIFPVAAKDAAPTVPKKAAVPKSAAVALPERITSVEGITEYRLPNGLKVLLFPDQSKPTITVNVTYLVGSRHEN